MLYDEMAVRQRAYEIWQAEGRIHGYDLSHWLRAQEEIDRAKSAKSRSPSVAKAKRRARVTASSAQV
jgi:hypothetical protein